MRRDDSGVGGFVEDLPVLFFVLGGVMMLVATSAWASQQLVDSDTQRQLDAIAWSVLERLLEAMRDGAQDVLSASKMNQSGLTSAVLRCDIKCPLAVSVWERYPEQSLLASHQSAGVGMNATSAHASSLLNAVDDRGLTVVLEVTVFVYR